MWVFICGGYRTGSVLQYNLVCEIVKRTDSGLCIGFRRPEGFAKLQSKYSKRKKYVVFKSHELTPEIEAEFKNSNAIGFKTIRDMRDVVVSLAHKYDKSYDEIIKSRINFDLKIFKPWVKLDDSMYIRKYEDFVFNLRDEIKNLAAHLKIELTDEIVEEIYEQCNINSHKKYIENTDYSAKQFDSKTMLHPNHINSGKTEQWKTKLNAEQIQEIEKLSGNWLKKHGYDLYSKS